MRPTLLSVWPRRRQAIFYPTPDLAPACLHVSLSLDRRTDLQPRVSSSRDPCVLIFSSLFLSLSRSYMCHSLRLHFRALPERIFSCFSHSLSCSTTSAWASEDPSAFRRRSYLHHSIARSWVFRNVTLVLFSFLYCYRTHTWTPRLRYSSVESWHAEESGSVGLGQDHPAETSHFIIGRCFAAPLSI